MKKFTALFLLLALFGCGNTTIEKPDGLIEEDQMVNIIYDLSLLDATRSQKPFSLGKQGIDPNNYIYKKYKIDSLQFARSNKYYAQQIDLYKKIYDRVDQRLKERIAELDSVSKTKPDTKSNADNTSTGVVR